MRSRRLASIVAVDRQMSRLAPIRRTITVVIKTKPARGKSPRSTSSGARSIKGRQVVMTPRQRPRSRLLATRRPKYRFHRSSIRGFSGRRSSFGGVQGMSCGPWTGACSETEHDEISQRSCPRGRPTADLRPGRSRTRSLPRSDRPSKSTAMNAAMPSPVAQPFARKASRARTHRPKTCISHAAPPAAPIDLTLTRQVGSGKYRIVISAKYSAEMSLAKDRQRSLDVVPSGFYTRRTNRVLVISRWTVSTSAIIVLRHRH